MADTPNHNPKETTLNTYTAQTSPVPNVRATNLATSGHHQAIVKCPRCHQLHRHLGLGVRRSPCGAVYIVREPRTRPAPAEETTR